ncbi:MAG: hypothetical protein KatS3mg056_0778 [Chloroflexus sp.]|jgi:hypothetical protein|nr:MAG: hypothetical protein KatS3mg056_0778 [Chloroflexus sp.]
MCGISSASAARALPERTDTPPPSPAPAGGGNCQARMTPAVTHWFRGRYYAGSRHDCGLRSAPEACAPRADRNAPTLTRPRWGREPPGQDDSRCYTLVQGTILRWKQARCAVSGGSAPETRSQDELETRASRADRHAPTLAAPAGGRNRQARTTPAVTHWFRGRYYAGSRHDVRFPVGTRRRRALRTRLRRAHSSTTLRCGVMVIIACYDRYCTRC